MRLILLYGLFGKGDDRVCEEVNRRMENHPVNWLGDHWSCGVWWRWFYRLVQNAQVQDNQLGFNCVFVGCNNWLVANAEFGFVPIWVGKYGVSGIWIGSLRSKAVIIRSSG